MTISRGYTGAPGQQVHFRRTGPDGAPTIVWLHQTASSSAMWERVLPLIPDVRHLALDTAGFGASDPLPGAPTIIDYAERLLTAITGLTDGPVLLVGHHTGAVIAGEVVLARPEIFRGLVLIGCVVIADDAEQEAFGTHYDHWDIDSGGQYVIDHIVPRLLKSVTQDDPGQMESELVSYLQAGPRYTLAYDAVYGYRAGARLPLLDLPTWCAVGELEGDPMVRWTRQAAEAIPGAVFVPIPDAGCELAFEAPEKVADLVSGIAHSLKGVPHE